MAARGPPMESRNEAKTMSDLSTEEVQDLRREIEEIRQRRRDARRKLIYPSKLDAYRDDIITMNHDGVSLADIAQWLSEHGVPVVKSTISRALKRWIPYRHPRPETQEDISRRQTP